MFPSKTPPLLVLQMLFVGATILSVLFFTGNALALLGLFFMPQIPVMPQHSEERAPAIGFTAPMGDDD